MSNLQINLCYEIFNRIKKYSFGEKSNNSLSYPHAFLRHIYCPYDLSFPSSPIPCNPFPSAALLLHATVSPPVISLSLDRSLTIEKSPADYRFPPPAIPFLMKKLFLFCYPHTLTIRLKRPVYRGFSGEGKCEGKLSPLTLALTLKSVLNPLVLPRHNPNQTKIKI